MHIEINSLMIMAKPKPVLIIGAILGVLIVAAGVVLPWYFFVYKNQPSDYPTWDLMFYGDTVEQSVNVTYEDIREEFNATTFQFNQTKWWDPDGYESVLVNFTGVSLWDIIQYSGVDYGTANAIKFVAIDGWKSPEISLEDVENNKSQIIVYYIEGEELLTGPEQGGNGYLMSAVNYSINESKKSSHFNVKWLIGVEFIIDWNVELFGDSSIVEENMTISYTELITSTELSHVNALINYTKPGISSELINVTGVTLWSLIQYLDVNYTTANGIRFVASDDFTSLGVPLSDVENEAEKILIVYMEDGVYLDPTEDGYLMSIVDYTLTQGTSSGQYKMKYLVGIEFLNLI
jgi:hypothetical protein